RGTTPADYRTARPESRAGGPATSRRPTSRPPAACVTQGPGQGAGRPREAAPAARPAAASAARAWRRAEVQRSVHARASLQYHRTSPHASPPSGTIWARCRWIPHIQHEKTAARRAAKPSAEGARVSSAMTASPPGERRDPDHGPKISSSQPGLAAGSTTAGWNANGRWPRPDDQVPGRQISRTTAPRSGGPARGGPDGLRGGLRGGG